MYIRDYNRIPLWAWNIDTEDITNVENLDTIEIKNAGEELDLLCSIDFIDEGL